MFYFMLLMTVITVVGCLSMVYIVFKFAEEVFQFKLLFTYITEFKLSNDEIKFVNSFDSYFRFQLEYNQMLKDCQFFSIELPNTVKEGIEIMIELNQYD